MSEFNAMYALYHFDLKLELVLFPIDRVLRVVEYMAV